MFIEAKDDGGGGDNWSYKSYKVPVKSSPPTNQNPVFLQAGCPSCRPTNSVKALKGRNITFYGLAYPKLTWGLPTLSLTTDSSWLPWGGLSCLSPARWCQYPKTGHFWLQKFNLPWYDMACCAVNHQPTNFLCYLTCTWQLVVWHWLSVVANDTHFVMEHIIISTMYYQLRGMLLLMHLCTVLF